MDVGPNQRTYRQHTKQTGVIHRSLQLACMLCGLLIHGVALAQFRGRLVTDVLDELRADGLTFIYNTQLVPGHLQVKREPTALGGLELAREVLAAHDLHLTKAAPGVYAITPASRKTAPEMPIPPRTEPLLENVVVQTSRYTLTADTVATQTFLTRAQVKNMPRLADETLRAVQRLPGTASDGLSALGPVRGGAPGETAVILNGLRLYEPFHLKNFFSPVSLLDSRVIDSIEFYSGGFPAIYGDRMSAIIDAETLRPSEPRYYEAGINLFHTSALMSTQFDADRGSALLSGRRGNVGDLARWSEKDFGEPHYSDGYGRIDYRFSDSTRASLDTLVSSDAIEAIRSAGAEVARARYRNIYAWATVDREWSERTASRLIVSYTDLANERHAKVDEPGARAGSVSDERLFHIVGMRSDNTFDGGRIEHRYGFEIRHLSGQYDYESAIELAAEYPFPGSPPAQVQRKLAPRPEGYESSAYWDGVVDLDQHWTLQGGMRVDTQTYDGSDDSEQWSPRLALRYSPGQSTHVRASWGRYLQSQGINELQVEDGIDRFHPAQHADHAILSLDHSFARGLELRVEAYRKYYRRLQPRFENAFNPLVLFPEAGFDRVRIDAHSARASGLEVLVRLRPRGPWSGWLGYSWSRVEDRIDGQDVPRSWDQTHAVNLGVVWSKGPWTATVANTYHSGWPTTLLELATSAAGEPQIIPDRRNRARFDYFNTLDLRVTRTFLLPRGVLDVFVEANNALARPNACCVRYDVSRNPDGSYRYSRDVDSWLPFVPSIGVLWRY